MREGEREASITQVLSAWGGHAVSPAVLNTCLLQKWQRTLKNEAANLRPTRAPGRRLRPPKGVEVSPQRRLGRKASEKKNAIRDPYARTQRR